MKLNVKDNHLDAHRHNVITRKPIKIPPAQRMKHSRQRTSKRVKPTSIPKHQPRYLSTHPQPKKTKGGGGEAVNLPPPCFPINVKAHTDLTASCSSSMVSSCAPLLSRVETRTHMHAHTHTHAQTQPHKHRQSSCKEAHIELSARIIGSAQMPSLFEHEERAHASTHATSSRDPSVGEFVCDERCVANVDEVQQQQW